MSKRIITVILCLSMLFSFCCSVNASSVQPRYNYVSLMTAGLVISNGTAHCQSDIETPAYQTERVIIEMHLEKKTLWWWDDVTSWTVSYKGGYCSLSENYTVGNGTYRVRTEFTVIALGGDTETITGYSEEVSA